MNQYLELDPWCIIENEFNPENNRVSESIFSIGNGYLGGRGNFEENYSGDSLKGNYVAGVYYPDKTRVGWWKNGYPKYFAKVINAINWHGIRVFINDTEIDLNKLKIINFKRILNMKEGYLKRNFTVSLGDKKTIEINSLRFLSIKRREIGAVKYSVEPNFPCSITLIPYLDGDVKNEDSNYEEKFWDEVECESNYGEGSLTIKTKKLDFYVCSSMKYSVFINKEPILINAEVITKEKYTGNKFTLNVKKDDKLTLIKYVSTVTSRDYEINSLKNISKDICKNAYETGFEKLLDEQVSAFDEKWNKSDIVISGDVEAQQAIRFNIFQLNQTYTGEDSRLNIGPKGFTGEKYGGSTYWDTEAYCLPFYLATSKPAIAKNLLLYRYKHLQKAKENAKLLGYKKGALYPMVTMNGEECHNEWEITFEEIHRNGAIAHAIYDYVNYTGDKAYLGQYGIDVLVEISRFWEERVNFVVSKDKYMILGVTGPNEYENNVNNNWYTNRIASWTLEYTLEVLEYLKNSEESSFISAVKRLKLEEKETIKWKDIINKMYYPESKELNIFLQQDGYLDKEDLLAKDINKNELPINQHWSWDRILRSPFIKQADVLQGMYFLNDKFDFETKKRNFDFYEPRTVHESSLSPCIHAILAAELGYKNKAYEMYLRTARLDLDNYNNDTRDGCHITSMAGTWMSLVMGIGGMRVTNGNLILNPFIPDKWEHYSFKLLFKGSLLKLEVSNKGVTIINESSTLISLKVLGKEIKLAGNTSIEI